MSTHPVGIALMATIFVATFGVVLAVTVALTLHLDRRRHAAVREARHQESASTHPVVDVVAVRSDG